MSTEAEQNYELDDRVPMFDDDPGPVPGEEGLHADVLADSMTGFDQIAIGRFFGTTFAELAKDELMLLRALYFVDRKHAGDGTPAADKVAFQAVMTMPIGEVRDAFANEDDGGDPDAVTDVAARDREFAEFVVGTGLSYTVDQFMALTLGQRAAVYTVANKRR